MAPLHPSLTQEKWQALERATQILNIAAELIRAKHCLEKEETEYFRHSLQRAYELLDLTITDPKWSRGRRELLRAREFLGGFYLGRETSVGQLQTLSKTLAQLDKDSALVPIG